MLSVDKLLTLIAAMNREGVEYVVFGAIAMAVHGLPRATEDADFFIRPERENIDRLTTLSHGRRPPSRGLPCGW
jgi:hypothetical protein